MAPRKPKEAGQLNSLVTMHRGEQDDLLDTWVITSNLLWHMYVFEEILLTVPDLAQHYDT